MKPHRMIPLFLAASLQVLPMLRAVLPAARTVAPSAWILVLKLASGAVAMLGSYHTVSGATTIVGPYSLNATNNARYTRQLTVSGRIPGSWSADTAPANSAIYPLLPGLYLTNVTGKIGGIPIGTGTTNVTITVWEFANNTGGKLSAAFTITAHPGTGPPAITVQPQSTTGVEGLGAMFTIIARGADPLSYQWRLNGGNIMGGTNSTLIVTNLALSHAGLYSVRVINSLGSTNSSNATLTVLVPPVILSQPSPASQIVSIGDPVTLAVTARGNVPMGFRWQRDGVTLTNMVLNTTNCAFTIPSAQLTHSGLYTVVITNIANTNGVVSSGVLVTVTSGSINVPPRLDPMSDQLVLVGDTLTLTARATDDNIPAQNLAYSLLPGAPAGASIHASSGLLIWPTAGMPAPATNVIGIRVTDNGSPSLSATQTIRVVLTANRAPTLAAIPDLTADVLRPVRYTNFAADADLPLDELTFSLGPGAPAGARIRPTNGVFFWMPSREHANSTNLITVIATDDGVPPRSDSRTLKVVVNDYVEFYSEPREELVGDVVDMPIFVRSSTPVSNLMFNVEFRAHFTNFTVASDFATAVLTSVESNRVGIQLTRASAQPANGETFAYLSFTVATNQPSAFVPMTFSHPVVLRPDGTRVDRVLTTPGRVTTIADTPLIEGFRTGPYVLIYGRPGTNYFIDEATNLRNGGTWNQISTHIQNDLVQAIFLSPLLDTNRVTLFFRVR